MSYTIVKDQNALNKALELARGSYQRDLLLGVESLSGATLRGKAKDYSGRYKESRNNLIARLEANNIPVNECRGTYNKRLLVIG